MKNNNRQTNYRELIERGNQLLTELEDQWLDYNLLLFFHRLKLGIPDLQRLQENEQAIRKAELFIDSLIKILDWYGGDARKAYSIIITLIENRKDLPKSSAFVTLFQYYSKGSKKSELRVTLLVIILNIRYEYKPFKEPHFILANRKYYAGFNETISHLC